MGETRVELPQTMKCAGCGKKIDPPYRGKPCMLLATELLLFCNQDCKRVTEGGEGVGMRGRGAS